MHTPQKAHVRFAFYLLLPWFPFAIYYLWIYEPPYEPPKIDAIGRTINLKKLKQASIRDSIQYIEQIEVFPNSRQCTEVQYATLYKCTFANGETMYIFDPCTPYKEPEAFEKAIKADATRILIYLRKKDLYQVNDSVVQVFMPSHKYIADGTQYAFGKVTYLADIDCGTY